MLITGIIIGIFGTLITCFVIGTIIEKDITRRDKT
jgi:hypothetical protein